MVKGWLAMTQVARLYEEEKIEYGNQIATDVSIKKTREIAKNFIEMGVDNLIVMKATGLTRAEIDRLRSEIDAGS